MADYSLLVNVEAIDKASHVFKTIQGNVNSFKSNIEGTAAAGVGSMEQLGQSMTTLGNNMTSTGRMMTATVTTPIVALGTAAVKTAADFDSQMSKVGAISGATGKDMQALRDKAIEMGDKTKFSATEAGQGFEYMAMAGWKTGDMLDGIEGIMNLAAASGEDLGTTSDIVTDALTAFGLSAKDSGHFADLLAAASSNANTNVSMMGETFKYAAPIAGTMGYSAEDTALAIGLMANAGIKASQAGTTIRGGLVRLVKPTEQVQAAMDKYGISLTDSNGKMYTLREMIVQLREKMGGLSEAEQTAALAAIFGTNAVSGWAAVVNSSEADFNKLTGAIDDCDGSSKKMAETMNDNLEGDLTMLKSNLQTLAISLGEVMIPVLRDATGILRDVVNKFNQLSPATKELIVKALAVTAAVGPILLVGGKLISGIGKLITLGSKIGGVVSGLGSAAGAAAPAVGSAGTAMGTLSANALGFIALGAGILLAAAGLALLAQAAIAIADAGAPAAIAMGAMVAVIALLAVGAAALAPALTAGAVGLVAVGAAVTLVGVGVLAASAGLSLLAPQLPVVAEYGGQAAVKILELSGAMIAFAAGATTAGAGAIVLGAGLLVASAGAVAATASGLALTAAILALSVGVMAASVAVLALAAGLALCAPSIVIIGNNANNAATGTAALTAAMVALLIPVGSAAGVIMAADAALLAFNAEMVVGTVAVVAMDVALVGMLASMSGIRDAATQASTAMKDIESSLNVVKTGVTGLGDLFSQAVRSIIQTFQSNTGTAQAAALALGTAITTGAQTGLLPIQANTTTIMTAVLLAITTSMATANTTMATKMGQMKTTTQTGMNSIKQTWTSGLQAVNSATSQQMKQLQNTIQSTLNSIQRKFASTKLSFNQHIALPHFSMSGSFNAQTGATPSVHVQWYGKAYDQAYMFQTPTVFGANGFGDGNGSEVVVGDEHLIDLIREAFSGGQSMGGDTIIPVYIGQERIDEIVVRANQRQALLSGGR